MLLQETYGAVYVGLSVPLSLSPIHLLTDSRMHTYTLAHKQLNTLSPASPLLEVREETLTQHNLSQRELSGEEPSRSDTHTHTRMRTHTHTHTHTHTYTNIHTHTHTHTHTNTHTHTHTHIHKNTYTHTHTHTYTHTNAYTNTHTHTHTHT